MTRNPTTAAIRATVSQHLAEAARVQADLDASRRIIEREGARCAVLMARRDAYRRRAVDAEELARQIERSERRRAA